MQDKGFFHVVIASDSLSLPRPWNQKQLDDKPDNFFRIDETYPFVLREKLRIALNDDVIVSNYAVRASSLQRASVMGPDLFSWMSADISIIHQGVVDCWLKADGEPRIPLDRFVEFVEKIYAEKSKYGQSIPSIQFGILPTNQRMLEKEPRLNDSISAFNEVLRTLIPVDSSTLFIDVERLPEDERLKIVHEDGHHLSRYGHQKYASIIFDQINKLNLI